MLFGDILEFSGVVLCCSPERCAAETPSRPILDGNAPVTAGGHGHGWVQSPHVWGFVPSLDHPCRQVNDGNAGGTSETACGSVFIHPVHQHQASGMENSCS